MRITTQKHIKLLINHAAILQILLPSKNMDDVVYAGKHYTINQNSVIRKTLLFETL